MSDLCFPGDYHTKVRTCCRPSDMSMGYQAWAEHKQNCVLHPPPLPTFANPGYATVCWQVELNLVMRVVIFFVIIILYQLSLPTK